MRSTRGCQRPTARIDTSGVIYSIQHHDFIGNHPLGKRLHQLTSLDTQRAAATLLILSPAIPMLFMGEEFASEHAFQFFVDFTDDHLRRAVVEGRKREYPQHDWSSGILPVDPQAFYDSKIGMTENGNEAMRDWYQSLIALRKEWLASGLLSDANLSVENDLDHGVFQLRYESDQGRGAVVVRLVAGAKQSDVHEFPVPGRLLLDSREGETKAEHVLPNHAKVFLT
jgi:1,4-alpha-glucan branching enzyme